MLTLGMPYPNMLTVPRERSTSLTQRFPTTVVMLSGLMAVQQEVLSLCFGQVSGLVFPIYSLEFPIIQYKSILL